MTTTELIEILRKNEFGGASGRPREVSFCAGDRIISTDGIEVTGSGDGLITELDLSLPDAETKKGHWIVWGGMDIPENHGKHICSVCGEFAPIRYEKPLIKEYLSDFCPNCGADMRGGE